MPKAIRERLRLSEGGEVEVLERGGVIEITPVPVEIAIESTPAGVIARPATPRPALANSDVLAVIDESRR